MGSGIPLMFLLWIGMIVYAHSSVADELTLEIDITPPEGTFTLICSSNSNESMTHTTWYRDGAVVLNSRKIEDIEHCDNDKPSSIPGKNNYTDSYYDKYILGRVSVSCTDYQHNLTLTTELTVHDGSVWRCVDSRNRGSNNLTLDFSETSRTDQTLPSRPSTVQQLPFTSTQIAEGSTQETTSTSTVKSANSTISITSSTTSTTSPTSTTTLTASTTFTKSYTPAVSQASVPVYLIIGLVAALLVVLSIIFVLVVCNNRIARVARRYIVTRKRPQIQELSNNEKANKGRRMSDINPNKKSDFVRSVLGSSVDP